METLMNKRDMEEISRDGKIALVATVSPEGEPHITLITSIQAKSEDQLILGEFCRGLSKAYMPQTGKTGLIVISLDKSYRTGCADWTGVEEQGEDFERMNMIPMFRYNTYFGIQRVHHLKLKEITKKKALPMGGIVLSTLLTRLSSGSFKNEGVEEVINPFSRRLIDSLDSLSFIAYVDGEGYPRIVPVIQAKSAGTARIVFFPGVFKQELGEIPAGCRCALHCVNMKMESVLVRGTYRGILPSGIFRGGVLDIDWVYNSMPPAHEIIYPRQKLQSFIAE